MQCQGFSVDDAYHGAVDVGDFHLSCRDLEFG